MIQLPNLSAQKSSMPEIIVPMGKSTTENNNQFEGVINNEENELKGVGRDSNKGAKSKDENKFQEARDSKETQSTREAKDVNEKSPVHARSAKKTDNKSSDDETNTESTNIDATSDINESNDSLDLVAMSEILSELVLGLNPIALSQEPEAVPDEVLLMDSEAEASSQVEGELLETINLIADTNQNIKNDNAFPVVDPQLTQKSQKPVETQFNKANVSRFTFNHSKSTSLNVDQEKNVEDDELAPIKLDLDQWLTSDSGAELEVPEEIIVSGKSANDQTPSNISNELNLEDFNKKSLGNVDSLANLNLKDSTQSLDPSVTVMASKSLLEANHAVAGIKSPIVDIKSVIQDASNVKTVHSRMNDMLDAKQVINQVFDSLKGSMGPDSQQIRLRLDPPEWGSIQIRMNMVKNDVNITLLADSQAVKEALDKGVQALRGQFMQQGINLGQVSIGVGNGSQQAEKDARDQMYENDRNPTRANAKPVEAVKVVNSLRRSDGVIDSHV